jgi:hypothetical protein
MTKNPPLPQAAALVAMSRFEEAQKALFAGDSLRFPPASIDSCAVGLM